MYKFATKISNMIFATTALLSAVGCGLATGNVTAVRTPGVPLPSGTGRITGSIHGGNSPIVGATVQLYVAGQSAAAATGASGTTAGTPGTYGTGYSALITPGTGGTTTAVGGNPYPVVTDANGGFNITGDYNCPAVTPAPQVYLVATAGNPGLGSGTNNLAGVTIAALGSCATLKANAATTFVAMNEVTTAATVVALQQFMSASFGTANVANANGVGTDGTINFGIGAPASNVVGMDNAFATAQVLANTSTGSSPGTSTAATVESAKINSIADILSVCINASGSTGTCQALEQAATPSGSPTAADTLQIALYMAQNPANNVANIYSYQNSTAPFVGLTAAPTDWTVAVQYAPQNAGANAVGGAFGIAADKFGNVWVSQNGNGSAPAASVVELGPTGTLLLPPVASFTPSATAGLAPVLTPAPATTPIAFASPRAVVIDSNNNPWVANGVAIAVTGTTTNASGAGFVSGATVTKIGAVARFDPSTASGTAAPGTVTGYYGVATPYGGAADGNGNVYFTSLDSTSQPFSKTTMGINSGGTFTQTNNSTASTTAVTTGTSAVSVAVDQNKTFAGGPNVFPLSNSSCGPYGDLAEAQTTGTTPLSVVTGTLSPISYGYSGGTTGTASPAGNVYCTFTVRQRFLAPVLGMYGVAADASSNLWITNNASTAYTTTLSGNSYTDSSEDTITYVEQILSTAKINTTAAGSVTTDNTVVTDLSAPTYLAVDGANHAWVVNSGAFPRTIDSAPAATGNCSTATPCNSVALFSSTPATPAINNLSGTFGFTHTMANPINLTIDLSGNVWVANNAASANYVTVIVGAAAPALPPSMAIAGNLLGLKP